MAVERRSDAYLYSFMDVREVFHDSGEVPAQVQAQRQEVRNDQNARDAGLGQTGYNFTQVGVVRFEEGHFDPFELPARAPPPG